MNPDIRDMDAPELRRYLAERKEAEYVLVDVRQPQEYNQGHIPGAKLAPLPELESLLPGLNPDQEYVFYCRSGNRSRTAAALAAQSGLLAGPIHNLKGGITAWDGLAVPGQPRLDVFDPSAAPRDMLLRAMDLEKGAWLFYRDVENAATASELCELMAGLTDMEVAHARAVYSRLRALDHKAGRAAPEFQELFDSLSGEVLEGGQSMAELAPWVEDVKKTPDCMPVAELALEIEMSAYDLYRSMAHAQAGTEAEPVFLDLAEQEKGHLRLILKRMDSFLKPLAG